MSPGWDGEEVQIPVMKTSLGKSEMINHDQIVLALIIVLYEYFIDASIQTLL